MQATDRHDQLSYGEQTSFANELYVAKADGSETGMTPPVHAWFKSTSDRRGHGRRFSYKACCAIDQVPWTETGTFLAHARTYSAECQGTDLSSLELAVVANTLAGAVVRGGSVSADGAWASR